VTNTIFGRWELAVADDVYIRYGSGTNIDAQTFKVRRLTIIICMYILFLDLNRTMNQAEPASLSN